MSVWACGLRAGVTIIFANQSYNISQRDLERVDVDYDCPKVRELFKLTTRIWTGRMSPEVGAGQQLRVNPMRRK
jgi:hypothetical protein